MPREFKVSEIRARLRMDGVNLDVKDRDQESLRETEETL